MNIASDDPVINRLLRFETGLEAGGSHPEHEVLATYRGIDGTALFAFCRHGLLLNPGAGERYVPFVEIDDPGYYNQEMVGRAKEARTVDGPAPLSIRLNSGETIDIALERRGEAIPDLLTIASLIDQRVVIDRAERGERRIGKGWQARG
jgi:hypothetical protein